MPRRLSLPRRESRRGASTDCTCTQVALWRGVLGARPGWSAASPPRDRERDPRGVCTFALARASVSPHPQVARRTPVGAPPHRNRRRPPHDRDHCTSPRRTGELAVRGGSGNEKVIRIRRAAGPPRASRARRRRPRAPAGRAGGHASRRGPDRATRVRRTRPRARRRGDCVVRAGCCAVAPRWTGTLRHVWYRSPDQGAAHAQLLHARDGSWRDGSRTVRLTV